MSDEFTQAERDGDELGYYAEPDFTTNIRACASYGPLQVCLTQISPDAIDFDVKLLGQRIGGGRVTRENAHACVGASVGLAKTKVCVTAKFDAKECWVEGEVCVRKFPSGWSCRGFKTKLLSW